MASLHGGSSAGKSDLCCGHSLDAVGRPGLHQSGLMSFCFAGCFSPGPRKNDLTIYWALGPFVRSFTLLVDPGDIYLPHFPQAGLSRRVLRTGSSEGGDGVSLVGDRWRRRLIDDRGRIDDRRWGIGGGGSSGPSTPVGTTSATAARAEAVRAVVRAPPAAVGPAPHVGPSAWEAGTDPHAPATSTCAPIGETAAATGRGWGRARGHAHARRLQQR
jgi:hypothetical protein